ncbi:MAG: efflux RND transporter periplasmic adaptor subunit, partial [Alphaproteobacteria bacterium]|nr:efflux RND transporter periplasmic adaptor subunit [Alphaproteobacteria bacterium]
PVKIATFADDVAVVDSGLDPGASVVVEGVAKLQQGTLVSIIPQNGATKAEAAPANGTRTPPNPVQEEQKRREGNGARPSP